MEQRISSFCPLSFFNLILYLQNTVIVIYLRIRVDDRILVVLYNVNRMLLYQFYRVKGGTW
ncbi:hypothetical protein BD408DRAFT_96358 [Parasitella parasitica]|nr:hypothetical protein BD408DRAFT_96358 [Parasitella parasitica]